MTSALELSRLFGLMEGVDPEGLFNAALMRAAGGDLGATGGLPPQHQGMEGLPASQLDDGGLKSGASPSGELQEGGGSTDDEGSVGGHGGGAPSVPPRTGSINDRKCTKVLPASSSAPKYKFVVPNEYVYKFMKHLVERPFHMRDMGGKLWDCVLIQRKNKEKYEYMIQGWRRFGEATGVQEGDTVTIEMVDDTIMQLTLEHTGGGSAKKRSRKSSGAGMLPGPAQPSGGAPSTSPSQYGGGDMQLAASLMQHTVALRDQDQQDQQINGLLGPQSMMQGPTRTPQQPGLPMQQQQQMSYGGGGGMGEPSSSGGPQGLLALIQQQHQQAAQHQQQPMGAMGGGQQALGGPGQGPLTPRSLSAHLANGLTGPLGQLTAGGAINEAQLADLTAVINHLEKRQRVGDGPSGGPTQAGDGPGGANAIQLLSDVADLEKVMAENLGLREELRMAQAKIATLETGVLNIKSVLTRNTDPGLIAMTGVINLLNQMESPDFLPELGTIGRMTLTGLCSEVRRHLNGVLRMVWILRSLPDDVQQHNMGGNAPGTNSGGAP